MGLQFIRRNEERIPVFRDARNNNSAANARPGHAPIGPSYSGVKIEYISSNSQSTTPIKLLEEDFKDRFQSDFAISKQIPLNSSRGVAKRLDYANPRTYTMQSSSSTPHLSSSKPGPKSFQEWRDMDFVTEGTEDIDELDGGSVSQKVSTYLDKNKFGRTRVTASHGTSFLIEPEGSAHKRSVASFEDRSNVVIRKRGVNDSPVSTQFRPRMNEMARPLFHSDQAVESRRIIGLVHVTPPVTPSKKLFFEDRPVPEERAYIGSHGNFSKVKMSGRIAFG